MDYSTPRAPLADTQADQHYAIRGAKKGTPVRLVHRLERTSEKIDLLSDCAAHARKLNPIFMLRGERSS
jgi:hypothetical protein